MGIRVEQGTKRFGTQLVLDRVTIDVAAGELFVLLGASGSGKSTILRAIAGLTALDHGRIALAGRDVTGLRPQERGTGFVFQNYSVFRHMTVGQNIEFGLKLRGVSRAERVRRRDELLELVGLPGFASREGSQLSGGQQQRVAIARALAYEPKVLLLDEPFGALDVKIRTQLRRSLRAIHDRLGITTLLVTHDQEEAFDLADRVGLMDRGRLIETGRAEELYARPRSLFAATFLGSGTVLIGRVEAGEARFEGLDLRVPADPGREDGSEAHLLVRPEDLNVGASAPGAAGHALGAGTIVRQSFAGALRRVRVRLPSHAEVHQASSTPSGPDGLTLDALLPASESLPEDRVWLSLRRWHFLDPALPSLLVADEGRGSSRSLRVARDLARGLDARVTVLGVADDAGESESLGRKIGRRQRRSGLADAELRLRYGHPATQILNEQAELLSRVIVVAPRTQRFAWLDRLVSRRRRTKVGRTLTGLLESSRVPVLIVIGDESAARRLSVARLSGLPSHEMDRVADRVAAALGLAPLPVEVADEGPEEAAERLLEPDSQIVAAPMWWRGPREINEIPTLTSELLSVADRSVLVVPVVRNGRAGAGAHDERSREGQPT
jgi:sulfate transport system ATP-binding protein